MGGSAVGMSLPFAECETCRGYIIEGTLAYTARGLKSRCRCDERDEAFRSHPDSKLMPTLRACLADFAALPRMIGRDVANACRDFGGDIRLAWRDFVWLRQL
jgi:hypothetical protein